MSGVPEYVPGVIKSFASSVSKECPFSASLATPRAEARGERIVESGR